MTLSPPVEIDQAGAARVAVYGLLEDALEFPTPDFHASVQSGAFRDEFEGALASLPFDIARPQSPGALITDDGYVDFQAEYIRLFDVGTVRPPCPLYGGEWGMARRSTMEDALRFYRFFGLRIDEGTRELPDHVTVELEFMEVMAYTEGTARVRGADARPLVLAQRDFLSRHLGKWFPLLRRKIGSQSPSPFYDALTDVADAFISADLGQLRVAAKNAAIED